MKLSLEQNKGIRIGLLLIFYFVFATVSGCMHSYTIAAVNTRNRNQQIKTRYRYKYVSPERESPGNETFESEGLAFDVGLTRYQPNVFDANGIPFTLHQRVSREEESGGWTILFPLMSYFLLPCFFPNHQDRIIEIKILGQDRAIAVTENCIRINRSMGHLSWMFRAIDRRGEPCLKGRTFSGDGDGFNEVVKAAFAYGIAAKLKELEEEGKIDETIAAKARVFLPMREQVLSKRRAISDATGIPVRMLENDIQIPIEIIKCECESGKDFSYNFEIETKNKDMLTLQGNNLVKSTLLSAIRSHYSTLHTELNPRSLIVDFPVYLFNGGRITGRCVVLAISVESLSYDAVSRKGVLAIRAGANQLDDVRRWIQKHIGDFVVRENVSSSGDEIPSGVHFRTGRETLQANGIFVIEFMTE